jgi:sarcosine/dimethylglycine N-methyltransferase
MNSHYSEVVETAREYYNSEDADNFYFHVWGGEDIHIGLYTSDDEDIKSASRRTVESMADQLAGINETSKVIDLGSGYGGSARYLASRFGCHVTALNLSETENERHRSMNRQQGLSKKIDVVDGSFEHIPVMQNELFDFAWSQDAILHSGHRAMVMDEVNRVLKPGGEFIFTDPMQADDCPPGVLKPVLDRIHLDSLGSFEFYRQQAQRLGWEEVEVVNLTQQLVMHYTRVRQELVIRRDELSDKVTDEYIDRMIKGLGHWIDAGDSGYLSWGIMHFRKPK